MTTKLTLHIDPGSNGDVHIRQFSTFADGDEMVTRESCPEMVLTPGQKDERWMSTSQSLEIRETWPTAKPCSDAAKQGAIADTLIASEVNTQDKMWGDANERADSMKGQLLGAALAQAQAIHSVMAYPHDTRKASFEIARLNYYPKDWGGFRDYGSDIANLVVAAAYIRNEIKRRLIKGESYHRAARTEPYQGPDQPAVSSADVLGTLMDMTQGIEGSRLKQDTKAAERGSYIGLTHTGKVGSPALTINEDAHGFDGPRYPPGDARNDTL